MNTKINSLNGLKGFMIWCIVLFHTYRANNVFSDFFALYGGDIGNQFFFAISGFLTCYSFSHNNKIKQGFTKWFGGKLLRIWPAYAFFNLIALISIGITYISVSDILLVFTMQTGGALTDLYPFDFPGWFLCTLVFCFCLFYLANYISDNTIFKSRYIYILLVFAGLILQIKKLDFPYLYFHDGAAIVPFFIGCIICSEYEIFKKNKLVIYLISVIALALCFYSSIGDTNMVTSFIFIPSMFLLCIENKPMNILLANPVSIFLSKICIFVYLTHTLDLFVKYIEISYLLYIVLVFICSSAFYGADHFIRKLVKEYIGKKKAENNSK